MSKDFSHIIKEDFSFGLIRLKKPRCIKWYGPDLPGTSHKFEWLDGASIKQKELILEEIENTEQTIAEFSGKELPLLNFETYMKTGI